MSGNGKHTLTIDVTPAAPGYVVVAPRAGQGILPDATPVLLSCALRDWILERPSVSVRATLPIVQLGQTVAIHVWFDTLSSPASAA